MTSESNSPHASATGAASMASSQTEPGSVQQAPILTLPLELIQLIALSLPTPQDIRRFATTSRDLRHALGKTNDNLWHLVWDRAHKDCPLEQCPKDTGEYLTLYLDQCRPKSNVASMSFNSDSSIEKEEEVEPSPWPDWWDHDLRDNNDYCYGITDCILKGKMMGCFECLKTTLCEHILLIRYGEMLYRTYCFPCFHKYFWLVDEFLQQWPEVKIPPGLVPDLSRRSERSPDEDPVHLEYILYNDAVDLINRQVPLKNQAKDARFLVMWQYHDGQPTPDTKTPTPMGQIVDAIIKRCVSLYQENYTIFHKLKSPNSFQRGLQRPILQSLKQVGPPFVTWIKSSAADVDTLHDFVLLVAKNYVEQMEKAKFYGLPELRWRDEGERLMKLHFGEPNAEKFVYKELPRKGYLSSFILDFVRNRYGSRFWPDILPCPVKNCKREWNSGGWRVAAKVNVGIWAMHIFEEHSEAFDGDWGFKTQKWRIDIRCPELLGGGHVYEPF